MISIGSDSMFPQTTTFRERTNHQTTEMRSSAYESPLQRQYSDLNRGVADLIVASAAWLTAGLISLLDPLYSSRMEPFKTVMQFLPGAKKD
jgi:hypothetical protein